MTIMGNKVKLYRVFWCNSTENELHHGCGNSFEVDQDELLRQIIDLKATMENTVSLQCPNCGRKIQINPMTLRLDEHPYRIESRDNND